MEDVLNKIKLTDLLKKAKEAGDAILEVYHSDFAVEQKEDRSPLTLADKRSHEIICAGLSLLYPEIPILSEEGREIPFTEREKWEYLWLIDPLDGTKEFIKRNGEFTVNIALIHNGKPVAGVIYVPVMKVFYFAKEGVGAYRRAYTREIEGMDEDGELLEGSERLPLAEALNRPFTVVGSRSHMSKETEEHINKLRAFHSEFGIISAGSSIKICMVADGRADVYPRFGPTMEWDTAAGQAIVEGAGGQLVNAETEEPLSYNREDLLNPSFIVRLEKG
ncbi:MAG: 3'(2'),5'-bisphosphate nucleotidase CysQ [Thermodesulfobacteriota bacterium]